MLLMNGLLEVSDTLAERASITERIDPNWKEWWCAYVLGTQLIWFSTHSKNIHFKLE